MSYLEEFKAKARQLNEAGKLAMLSHSDKHIAFKEAGDQKIHLRYLCPCGNKQELYAEFNSPYKVKCSSCKQMVWESKLRKKPRKLKVSAAA